MIYNVYSIQDVKTSFAMPFTDISDASAERGFLYSYLNSQSLVNFSPADFRLFRIGTFCSDDAVLTPCTPVFICDATKFQKVGDINET